MTNRLFGRIARPIAVASSLLIGAVGFALAPSAWAAGVATLSGTSTNSCSYTTIQTLPDGTVTVTCSSASPTSATITFGNVSGSLSTTGTSVAILPVTCAGACGAVAVGLAVTSPASGVTLGQTTVNFSAIGSQNVSVNGAGGLVAGSAQITLTVNSIGSATSSTPPVAGTISASVPIVDASAPGTLAFSPTTSLVTENAPAVTVNVTRSGAGSSATDVSVPYSCVAAPSGYLPTFTPAASGTLTWAGADATAKSFSITPLTLPSGASTGTVTCTLGTPTGGATASATPYVLTVNKASAGGNCSTVADKEYDLSTSSISRVGPTMGPTQTAAVKIKAAIGTSTKVTLSTTWPVSGAGIPGVVQVNIAACPGDFTTNLGTACGPSSKTSNKTDRFTSATGQPTYYCGPLDPNQTYYFNVRWFDPATGQTSCTSLTCAVWIDRYLQ